MDKSTGPPTQDTYRSCSGMEANARSSWFCFCFFAAVNETQQNVSVHSTQWSDTDMAEMLCPKHFHFAITLLTNDSGISRREDIS